MGALLSVLLLVGGTWWASQTEISGAVIASGTVQVTGRAKSVQHLDGGIIAELHVAEGDSVEQGASMVMLDDTALRANLHIYRGRLSEAQALRDRLIAEQTDADSISFAALDALVDANTAAVHQAGQSVIFNARKDLETGRRERLIEKMDQFQNQTDGVEALIDAKQRQMDLIKEEIAAAALLTQKGLARASQLRTLQREEAEMLGQVAEHRSEIARIQNSVRDTEIEILQGRREIVEDVVTQLRETMTAIEELRQQITTTTAQLDRIEIRAPNSGRIHEMQFTTLGGVVPPGAVILQIIPRDQGFSFMTRVDPAAIDQVFNGQKAKVLFPAFNQRTTPELKGAVKDVSATTSIDEYSGMSFYNVEISVSDLELARLGEQQLISGMPVEAYLTTSSRTILSYLTKPLSDQLKQTFRE